MLNLIFRSKRIVKEILCVPYVCVYVCAVAIAKCIQHGKRIDDVWRVFMDASSIPRWSVFLVVYVSDDETSGYI
jgi:hypothetical protein